MGTWHELGFALGGYGKPTRVPCSFNMLPPRFAGVNKHVHTFQEQNLGFLHQVSYQC